MRILNLFSLTVMIVSALFTWKAIALEENKIHILENLDAESLNKVMAVLKERGYRPSGKPIFTESNSTVVFTKTEASELETASMKIEIIMKQDRSLPKTVFVYRTESSKVEDVLTQLPSPEKLREYQVGLNETPSSRSLR